MMIIGNLELNSSNPFDAIAELARAGFYTTARRELARLERLSEASWARRCRVDRPCGEFNSRLEYSYDRRCERMAARRALRLLRRVAPIERSPLRIARSLYRDGVWSSPELTYAKASPRSPVEERLWARRGADGKSDPRELLWGIAAYLCAALGLKMSDRVTTMVAAYCAGETACA
jgi:hypothetical protein